MSTSTGMSCSRPTEETPAPKRRSRAGARSRAGTTAAARAHSGSRVVADSVTSAVKRRGSTPSSWSAPATVFASRDVVELSPRHLEREMPAQPESARARAAGRGSRPPTRRRLDQAALLDDRQDVAPRDQAAIGVALRQWSATTNVPSRAGRSAGRSGVRASQRSARAWTPSQREPPCGGRRRPPVDDDRLVAVARVRGGGMALQGVGARGVFGMEADADRGGDLELEPRDRDRLAQRAQQPVGDRRGGDARLAVEPAGEQQELVAAVARRACRRAAARAAMRRAAVRRTSSPTV